MKITYDYNPLAAKIELTPEEQEILKLKLRIEMLEDMMYMAHLHMREGTEWYDLDKARHKVDPDRYMTDEPSEVDKGVEHNFKYYMESLTDWHSGDCTAHCASCTKCHAEGMLGISTIDPYPGKHVMNSIYNRFAEYDPVRKVHLYHSWEEALAILDEKIHYGKYSEEAQKAKDYLLSHIQKHFPEELQ